MQIDLGDLVPLKYRLMKGTEVPGRVGEIEWEQVGSEDTDRDYIYGEYRRLRYEHDYDIHFRVDFRLDTDWQEGEE